MAENADPSSASRKPQDPASKTPDPTSPPAESSPADLEDGEYEESAPNAPPLPAETAPPLPTEAPPLPSEAPPEEDDGWAPVWDNTAQAFYFYNRFTHATQWTNPRVPEGEDANIATATTLPPPPGLSEASPLDTEAEPPIPPEPTGYNPAIHGSYDPTAWYAQPPTTTTTTSTTLQPPPNPADPYAASAAFNRFTGRFQAPEINSDNFNDENKSKRQMNAFFDVDAAANSHDGRSLKAERSGKKLSKGELKGFKEKRKAKKEERRRAWLRD